MKKIIQNTTKLTKNMEKPSKKLYNRYGKIYLNKWGCEKI